LTASILKGKDDKTVYLSVSGNNESKTIIANEIILPPKGYHDVMVRVEWKTNTLIVITIDHDFGDGNHVYEYDVLKYTFKKL